MKQMRKSITNSGIPDLNVLLSIAAERGYQVLSARVSVTPYARRYRLTLYPSPGHDEGEYVETTPDISYQALAQYLRELPDAPAKRTS